MNLVLTQEGALLFWQYMLALATPRPPVLHLLGRPFTPLHTSVQADYAANELEVQGYSPIVLAGPAAVWAFMAISQGQEALNQPPPWTFGAPCTVYGWWMSDYGNTTAVCGAAWSPPYVFSTAGGQFYVALQPSLISQP